MSLFPSPLLSSLSSKEDRMMVSLDSVSTSSTDSESSFSNYVEDEKTDIESLYGPKLRHRTGDLVFIREDVSVGDSDSEHGPIPRNRRQSSWIRRSNLVYSFLIIAGLSFLAAMKSRSSLSPESVRWKYFLSNDVPIIRKALSTYEAEDQYTIILKGNRLDLLLQSLDSFARCPSLKEIQLNYEDGEVPIALQNHDSKKVVPPGGHLSTEALFLLSEGVLLSCNEMEKAFRTWRKDPRRLVGFFGYTGFRSNGRKLSSLEPVAAGSGSYSIVSDRAVFVHKRYFDRISGIQKITCCEFSLSLHVSVAFGKSPVVMKAKPVDLLERPSGSRISKDGDEIGETVGACYGDCIPSWIQLDEIHAIPHRHTAVLG